MICSRGTVLIFGVIELDKVTHKLDKCVFRSVTLGLTSTDLNRLAHFSCRTEMES